MIGLNRQEGSRPKCYFTSSILPDFVNHDQIPTKKKPFSTISERKFNHTLILILPTSQAEDFKAKIEGSLGLLQYMKVYMKLSELIDGDFFNQYIKSGNVLMLSEGRKELDNVYSLCDGILRLEVDKATYERMGLDGASIASGGRKHVKTRYAVELNLRLPSMVRGKHGFERVVWAFKNVLKDSVTWLFYDFNGNNDGTGPIAQHQPKAMSLKPGLESFSGALIPEPTQEIHERDHDLVNELLEWLTLAAMCSPRTQRKDKIDNYLSRYRVPGDADLTADSMTCTTQDLVRFRWHGFIPATFIKTLILAAFKTLGAEWFALTAAGFDGKSYSILQRKNHTMTWECTD